MNFLFFILLYSFSSSILFSYCIGIERLFIFTKNPKNIFKFLLKNMSLLCLAIMIIWPLNKFILQPLNIKFFIQIFGVLILFGLNITYKIILPNFFIDTEKEEVLTYGTLILALFTATSFLEALAIPLSVGANLLIFSLILNMINKKIENGNATKYLKSGSLIIISIGFLATAFYFNF